MNSIHELAAFGFVLTEDDDLVVSKPVSCAGMVVHDNAYIGGDATVSEDIVSGGAVTSEDDNLVYLSGTIIDANAGGERVYFIMPFDGWIFSLAVVLWANAGASGCTVYPIIDGVDKTDITVTVADGGLEGATYVSENTVRDYARFSEGSLIRVNVGGDGCTNAINIGFVLAVRRTQR